MDNYGFSKLILKNVTFSFKSIQLKNHIASKICKDELHSRYLS